MPAGRENLGKGCTPHLFKVSRSGLQAIGDITPPPGGESLKEGSLMASYQLKDLHLFVDATDRQHNVKKPDDIPFPHVMDKSVTPATYIKLNDAAAFIARFLVMGVDTDDIAQILSSEYGSRVKDPGGEVQAVVAMLYPDHLENRTFTRNYQAPKDQGHGNHSGVYELNFRVNWFVTGGFKGPL
jgi:hypothetical protein